MTSNTDNHRKVSEARAKELVSRQVSSSARQPLPTRSRALLMQTERAKVSGTVSARCRASSQIASGGDIACDHYHRWRDDIAVLNAMGLSAYRFSFAWTRLIPDGKGAINDNGIAFYDRLIDDLLSAGIEPYATLYHWDLPQALQDRGGWYNGETAEHFAAYAAVATRALATVSKNGRHSMNPGRFSGQDMPAARDAPGLKDGTKGGVIASHRVARPRSRRPGHSPDCAGCCSRHRLRSQRDGARERGSARHCRCKALRRCARTAGSSTQSSRAAIRRICWNSMPTCCRQSMPVTMPQSLRRSTIWVSTSIADPSWPREKNWHR